MTVATCLVAAWSLMSCGGVLQRTYRSSWRLGASGSDNWRRDAGRRLLWAGSLVVYVGATFGLADVSAHGLLAIARDGVRIALALAFFAWGPYVLLGRAIDPRRLLPTAILGALSLGALTAVAPLYLPNVASAGARSYGLVGFAFSFLTWLFVQALLIVGAAVAGAVIGERLGRRHRG
jgi:membrane protein